MSSVKSTNFSIQAVLYAGSRNVFACANFLLVFLHRRLIKRIPAGIGHSGQSIGVYVDDLLVDGRALLESRWILFHVCGVTLSRSSQIIFSFLSCFRVGIDLDGRFQFWFWLILRRHLGLFRQFWRRAFGLVTGNLGESSFQTSFRMLGFERS